jgi:hypothetical protein
MADKSVSQFVNTILGVTNKLQQNLACFSELIGTTCPHYVLYCGYTISLLFGTQYGLASNNHLRFQNKVGSQGHRI